MCVRLLDNPLHHTCMCIHVNTQPLNVPITPDMNTSDLIIQVTLLPNTSEWRTLYYPTQNILHLNTSHILPVPKYLRLSPHFITQNTSRLITQYHICLSRISLLTIPQDWLPNTTPVAHRLHYSQYLKIDYPIAHLLLTDFVTPNTSVMNTLHVLPRIPNT